MSSFLYILEVAQIKELYFNFFKANLFIYLFCNLKGKKKESERECERKFICCFISQMLCNNWGWAKLDPGTRDSIWVSHVGVRDSSTWTVIYCLLRGSLAAQWNQKPSWGLNPGTLIWDDYFPSDILMTYVKYLPQGCYPSFKLSLHWRKWSWTGIDGGCLW